MSQPGSRIGLAAVLLALIINSCATSSGSITPGMRPLPTDASTLAPGHTAKAGITAPIARVTDSPLPTPPVEIPIQAIPLEGPLKFADAQVSGLAWFGDTLIILPQYPGRYPGAGSAATLFGLAKSDIFGYLDETIQGPLVPTPIPFDAAGISAKIQGFEGFEAIAFSAGRVFLTIEARGPDGWTGYLVAGTVGPIGAGIRLDSESTVPLIPPADITNKSDEALVVAGDEILSLFEANGSTVIPNPVARVFDQETLSQRQIPLMNVEYRITDATPADENGQFWALNVFWPGEFILLPLEDPVANRFGEGPSHAGSGRVERLLKFEFKGSRIDLVDQAPIQLELEPGEETRNWEGLATLDERGFLLATDEFPTTILAFVPLP